MKKTQFTELFANIRATLVSFLSVVLFVALGVGLYSGLCWSAKALQNGSDKAFTEGNLHGVEVTFPYGITQDDIDAVGNLDGVTDTEPAYVAYGRLDSGNGVKNAAIRSLASKIDKVAVDEGQLPAGSGEAAIDSLFAKNNGLHVGDTVALVRGKQDQAASQDGARYLKRDVFTITALVTSPVYLSNDSASFGTDASGNAVDCVMFVPEETFDYSELGGYFNTLLVSSSELEGLSVYSAEFKQRAGQLVERIQAEGANRAQTRFDEFIASMQARVDRERAKLEKANAKAANGEKRLAEAQNTIDSKTREVEDAQLELSVTTKLLDSQEKMTREQLDQVDSQIAGFEKKYRTARALVDERVQKVDDLQDEYKGVRAYTRTLKDSYSKLSQTYVDVTMRYDSGQISQAERDALISSACKEFSNSVKSATSALKKTSPTIYKQCKSAVDNISNAASAIESADTDNLKTALAVAGSAVAQADILTKTTKSLIGQAKTAANDATKQMDSFKKALEDVKRSYAKQTALLNKKISDGRSRVANGQAKVEDGKAKLADAQSKVNAKTQYLLDAQTKLEDGKRQLANAQSRIDSTVQMSWICMPANYNGGIIYNAGITDVLRNLRGSMASLFVIVGLLVCYSAVSRIVHEQIRQLGTKKALGFTNGEVTRFYLAYSGCAVVLGALIGIGVAMLVVEPILIPSINRTVLSSFDLTFSFEDFAAISVVELVLILLSTYVACHGVLRRSAIELLQGEKPPQNRQRFYEKWNIWGKLPLLTQTIINNCVNDRRRIISTLIGVAGCTALIVSAVTLKDNVSTSFTLQENDICTYDAYVYCNEPEEGSYTVNDVLGDEGLSNAQVMRSTLAVTCPDNKQQVATLYVPQDQDAFTQLFHLNSLGSGNGKGSLEGAWVAYAYANSYNAKVGDNIKVENSLGQAFEIPIVGFFQYHSTGVPLVMSAGAYEHFMGTEPQYSGYLVDTAGMSQDEFQSKLARAADFVSMSDEAATIHYLTSSFEQLSNTMVGIYIALSALMAVIVLLNLNIMFINEKKRELIVLMINGYSVKDAKRYIYRDSVVITVIGIVLGCLLGVVMGYFTVSSAEGPAMAIMKFASWRACLVGGALAAVFAAAMTAIALRLVPRFKLTDINK